MSKLKVSNYQKEEIELLSLQHEIRTKNIHLQTLQAKYQNLERNFKAVLMNHKAMLQHLEDVKGQMEGEREVTERLQKENQKLLMRHQLVQQHKERKEELINQVKALKKCNQKLERAMLEQRKDMNSKEAESFKKEIELLKEENMKLEKINRSQFLKYEEFKMKLETANKQSEEYRAKIAKSEVEIKSLTWSNATLKKQIKDRKKEEENLLSKLKQSESLVSERDQKIASLQQQIKYLQNEEKMLRNQEQLLRTELEKKPDVVYVSQERSASTPVNTPTMEEDEIEFLQSTNQFELELKHFRIDKGGYPYKQVVPMFFSVDFFEHKTECTEINDSGKEDQEIDTNIQYPIDMSKYLLYYVFSESILIELRAEDGFCIGVGKIPLSQLIDAPSVEKEIAIYHSKKVIGHLSYAAKFKTPLSKCISGEVDFSQFRS